VYKKSHNPDTFNNNSITNSILYDRLIGKRRRRNHHQAGASSPVERSPVREGERDFEKSLE